MAWQSKRTSAPVPHAVPPLGAQPVPPSAIPLMFGPDAWCPPCPPQSMAPAPSAASCWFNAVQQQPGMAGSPAQGPWWAPAGVGASTAEDQHVQAWGVDSTPPDGFLNFLNKNTTPSYGPAQAVSKGGSSQLINVGDDTNGADCGRTEKCLIWTKDEDRRLVS